MAKKTIDVIIDKVTGKISVHVDGYPQKECSELAKKLAGNNSLIPIDGDIFIPKKARTKTEDKTIVEQKEVTRNE